MQRPINLKILGTGEYKPERIMQSEEFDVIFKKQSNWTAKNMGVNSRRIAGSHETSSFMAAAAARDALSAASLKPNQLDCIVSACAVMEQPIPCLASLIQRQLGIGDSGIPAFDVNATCLSFVVALDMIACAMAVGRYRRAMIVSSEIASAGLNATDPSTAGLFGDGAAAIVIELQDEQSDSALIATHIETYGDGSDLCQLRSGGTKMRPHENLKEFLDGTYFEMNGKGIYRHAVARFPSFVDKLLAKANVVSEDLTCVIPHQASGRALDHVAKLINLHEDRIIRVLEDHGNQIAASIPVALHSAIQTGRIKRGNLVMLLGTGAGFSLGGTILRY